MRALGGYFGLELPNGKSFHTEAIALNSGRNAFEYILLARRYRKVYLPYYSCPVLLQPIKRLGLEVECYSINEQFEPNFDFSRIREGEGFIYTNYFGLKDAFIAGLYSRLPGLIVDNAQAFFAKPLGDSFYSPRKFFGVPDGGYAYCGLRPDVQLGQGRSAARAGHLLIRADEDAEQGYAAFCAAEEAISEMPLQRMSHLTQQILRGIEYERVAEQRKENFRYLHEALRNENRLCFSMPEHAVPLAYPFMGADSGLRGRLISSRVFVAQYWPKLETPAGSFEEQLVKELVPLPIDQRLRLEDLEYILNLAHNHAYQG